MFKAPRRARDAADDGEDDGMMTSHTATTSMGSSAQVVVPGEVITSDTSFMRGHGTYNDEEKLVASVLGVVDRVNRLISVKPLRARYAGEIGDVVVGRIMEVGQKRWKVDIAAKQDAILPLAAVDLPGGELRRRSESDELQMRSLLNEGDLISAEIQAFFQDGAVSLHTRSLKYGKLRTGSLVTVSPSLIRRSKSHFLSMPFGVDIVLGLNGYIWVCKHEEQGKIAQDVTHEFRETLARVCNCIMALASQGSAIFDTSIHYAYEASLQYDAKDVPANRVDIVEEARNRMVLEISDSGGKVSGMDWER
ncbi:Exosome complex component RRP4 [Phlyctochytrium planicorne]|nr:Exosome complex component RRP4 [Phlyctochytrium planicorne]